jgi:hypothetical protein
MDKRSGKKKKAIKPKEPEAGVGLPTLPLPSKPGTPAKKQPAGKK